jgi:Zn-finger nucleic acid-binding protein
MMTERQGVEIDYCPECRGVWLDRNELDKIIERSMVQSAAVAPNARQAGYEQVQPQYRQKEHHGSHDDHGYRQGGHNGYPHKKSWLTELFD